MTILSDFFEITQVAKNWHTGGSGIANYTSILLLLLTSNLKVSSDWNSLITINFNDLSQKKNICKFN